MLVECFSGRGTPEEPVGVEVLHAVRTRMLAGEKAQSSMRTYTRIARGTARGKVVVPVPAVVADLDRLAERWGVHHLAGADVQADVVDVAWCAVEDQVARE